MRAECIVHIAVLSYGLYVMGDLQTINFGYIVPSLFFDIVRNI